MGIKKTYAIVSHKLRFGCNCKVCEAIGRNPYKTICHRIFRRVSKQHLSKEVNDA